MPKELDIAIKRLEAGEDPEKIEEDMGDVLGDLMGGAGGGGGYAKDRGCMIINSVVAASRQSAANFILN